MNQLLKAFFIMSAVIVFSSGSSYAREDEFDSSTYDEEFDCEFIGGSPVSTFSKTVLNLKVNLDGTGAVKVLVDSKGELLSISFDYTNRKGEYSTNSKTIDEFNLGQEMGKKSTTNRNALSLKVKAGTKISKTTGGVFNLSLLNEQTPVKYSTYQLEIKKIGSEWKVYKGGTVITSLEVSPNLDWFEWEGTFDDDPTFE